MAKGKSKMSRERAKAPKTAEQKQAEALLDTEQNRTWLKAFPKWTYSPTRLDNLPLEILKEILMKLDPVSAYAFAKANYPRLESTWQMYGPVLSEDWPSTVASDAHLFPISTSRRMTVRTFTPGLRFSFQQRYWILSSSLPASSADDNIWQSGLRRLVHPMVLDGSIDIKDVIRGRPEHARFHWQERFWYWIKQIFAYHMLFHHRDESATAILKCMFGCEYINLPIPVPGQPGIMLNVTRAPYIAIRLNADTGVRNRWYYPGFRAVDVYSPGAVMESVLLTKEDLKRMVANVQTTALMEAWEGKKQVRYVEVLRECGKFMRVFLQEAYSVITNRMWSYPLVGY